MIEDYDIGVWDVILELNLSDSSIKDACETDAPTCVMVFELHPHGDEKPANPHQSPSCRLCDMIELYASEAVGVDEITTYSKS